LRARRNCRGDCGGCFMQLLPAMLSLERGDDMQAAAAGSLYERYKAAFLEFTANMDRGRNDVLPAYSLAGIEIENQAVRLFRLFALCSPAMKFDDAELSESEIALGIPDSDIGLLLLAFAILHLHREHAFRHAGEGMA